MYDSSIQLRPYQTETLEAMKTATVPSLNVLATGLGKTFIFTHYLTGRARNGQRCLILSHREELVRQPLAYFPADITKSMEQGKHKSNGTEMVVSASIPTMVQRLERFRPDAFDVIIVDECHHSAAPSWRKVLDFFKPHQLFGFTATPGRADGKGLDTIYKQILVDFNIKYGIKNGFLCDIFARRVNIGYNLDKVTSRCGDYAPGELATVMDGTEEAIAQAFSRYAKGPTIIFAASVPHAQGIARCIRAKHGSEVCEVITGDSKNRQDILDKMIAGELRCIINVMVLTEGVDLPCVETVLMARPTKSYALYSQMIGRGLRLYPGKDKMTLIDCVGVSDKPICTASSLLGIDEGYLPVGKRNCIEGPLFEIPQLIQELSDSPLSWVRNTKMVNVWAQEAAIDLHDVVFYRHPDGLMTLSVPGAYYVITPPNALERCSALLGGKLLADGVTVQQAVDAVVLDLRKNHPNEKTLWAASSRRRWAKEPATKKQWDFLKKILPGEMNEELWDGLTKGEAALITDRMKAKEFIQKQKGGVA